MFPNPPLRIGGRKQDGNEDEGGENAVGSWVVTPQGGKIPLLRVLSSAHRVGVGRLLQLASEAEGRSERMRAPERVPSRFQRYGMEQVCLWRGSRKKKWVTGPRQCPVAASIRVSGGFNRMSSLRSKELKIEEDSNPRRVGPRSRKHHHVTGPPVSISRYLVSHLPQLATYDITSGISSPW